MVRRFLTAFYPSASVVFIWWRYLNNGSLDMVRQKLVCWVYPRMKINLNTMARGSSCTQKNHVCADKMETTLLYLFKLHRSSGVFLII